MLTGIAFLLAAASPTATAAPSATPAPCNRDVTVQNAVVPDYPYDRSVGSARVEIDVLVDSNGKVTSERVLKSAGIAGLDQAALSAAAQSTYLPKMVDCKPAEGHFRFFVTFE